MPQTTFEFPLTVYDRPAIAAANLLSGNLDATTRAIFSPMTLSPEETKKQTKGPGKEGEDSKKKGQKQDEKGRKKGKSCSWADVSHCRKSENTDTQNE